MHLCYLLPPIEYYSPQLGGALATLTMQQGRRLQKMGHRVSVLAIHGDEEVYDVGEFHALRGATRAELNLLQRGFSTKIRRRVARTDWLYFEYFRAAAVPILEKLRPDAVLCFNDWQSPIFVKETLPDARVFLRLSNECGTSLPSLTPALSALERIFALSTYVRDWTMERFDLPAERFTLLPNGADLDSFFPAPDGFERVLDAATPLRALFLSRLDPNKGPDLAADAVRLVRERGLEVELSVAGNIWFSNTNTGNRTEAAFVDELRAKAALVGAPMLGHVARPAVPELVRAHDVLLLPIRNDDPMTQVVFEAMASGLAIVSCALGGVPEACGDAALWAKPDDPQSVADLLERLCRDRAFLVERKKASIERAAVMSWDRNAAIFHEILSHPPQPTA